MTRNNAAMPARVEVEGRVLHVDFSQGHSLARSLDFEGKQLHFFGAEVARSVPLVVGEFSGRVQSGAGCNCSTITLTPHCNGTHTESVGHLTAERADVHRLVPQQPIAALLLSVAVERAAHSLESTVPTPAADDLLLTARELQAAWREDAPVPARALILRTHYGSAITLDSDTRAPFLSREAAAYLVERGIEHLVLDLPSLDRTEDEGQLTAHRIFFGLPPGSARLAHAQRAHCTITELAYMDETLRDGWYLLSLQTPAIAGDAVPSRPVIYALI